MNKDIKIMSDLRYEYVSDTIPHIIINADIDSKDYELAHIDLPGIPPELLDQERTYNYCLEIAHNLGYYLEGEMEEYKNDNIN